jgi:hypothetical protein
MSTIQQWGRKESVIWPPRGVIFVKFLAKLIGNDFQASAEFACVEGNGLLLVDDSVAFVPP